MSRIRCWIDRVVLGTLVQVAFVSSCGGDEACEEGETRECSGEDGCVGEQLCAGSPKRWFPCECSEPPGPRPSSVGARCDDDGACQADETCLDASGSTFLSGSPAVGVCTVRCDNDPAICTDREPSAVCVVTDDGDSESGEDDRAHCLERCTVGAVSGDRCQGDERLACAELDSFNDDGEGMRAMSAEESGAACRPLCASDDDCPGQRCDLRAGVCTSANLNGDPLGAECDPESEQPTCEGVCVEVDGVAFCSNRCWYGSAMNCGSEPPAGGEQRSNNGMCWFPEEADGSIGDTGFCALLCDVDEHCAHEGLNCELFDDSAVVAIVGRQGVCSP